MKAWTARNRERIQQQRKQYAQKNRAKLIAYYRQWRIDNEEKYRASLVIYRERNREAIRQRQREYVRKNPEKIRNYIERNKNVIRSRQKLQRQTPEFRIKNRANSHRRRAMKKKCACTATKEQVRMLLIRARRCYYCNRRFGKQLPPTVDHVVPISTGGPHSIDNLLVACKSCNSVKRDKSTAFMSARFGVLPL